MYSHIGKNGFLLTEIWRHFRRRVLSEEYAGSTFLVFVSLLKQIYKVFLGSYLWVCAHACCKFITEIIHKGMLISDIRCFHHMPIFWFAHHLLLTQCTFFLPDEQLSCRQFLQEVLCSFQLTVCSWRQLHKEETNTKSFTGNNKRKQEQFTS